MPMADPAWSGFGGFMEAGKTKVGNCTADAPGVLASVHAEGDVPATLLEGASVAGVPVAGVAAAVAVVAAVAVEAAVLVAGGPNRSVLFIVDSAGAIGPLLERFWLLSGSSSCRM